MRPQTKKGNILRRNRQPTEPTTSPLRGLPEGQLQVRSIRQEVLHDGQANNPLVQAESHTKTMVRVLPEAVGDSV